MMQTHAQIDAAPMQFKRFAHRAAWILYDKEHMVDGETVTSVRALVECELRRRLDARAYLPTVTPVKANTAATSFSALQNTPP
jgi:hypothetical protein